MGGPWLDTQLCYIILRLYRTMQPNHARRDRASAGACRLFVASLLSVPIRQLPTPVIRRICRPTRDRKCPHPFSSAVAGLLWTTET